MKSYCKITTSQQPQMMPNRYKASYDLSNDENWKATIAQHDGWLEMVYTEQPEYDPETQYVVSHWEEQNGKAVQVWEVKPIEPPETVEEEAET